MAEVGSIAVIGAGIMGRGIAHAAALGGYRTILEDILPAALRKAEGEIRGNLDKGVELGKVGRAEADAALARIEFAGSIEEAARQADLVIEAVQWPTRARPPRSRARPAQTASRRKTRSPKASATR